MLMKLTPGHNFTYGFTLIDPESVKRHWWLNCIFYAFGVYKRKSCTQNVDEIDTRLNVVSTFLVYGRYNLTELQQHIQSKRLLFYFDQKVEKLSFFFNLVSKVWDF